MKPTMLVLVLLAAVVGLTACAKYPVVVGASVPAAAAPAPPR
jgi:hypothetical protein